MQSRRIVAGVHALLAAVHVYWATGATWPALDERSLSRAVLGVQVSFAPQVVLPLAALHLMLAAAVLYSNRSAVARLAVAGVAAGLATRAALGVAWAFTYTSTPFYWLNLVLYTPACIALSFADVGMLRIRWLKAAVIAGPVAVVTMLAAVAYVYEPDEQAHPADAALVSLTTTPHAASGPPALTGASGPPALTGASAHPALTGASAHPAPTGTSAPTDSSAASGRGVVSRYVETPLARVHYLVRGSGAPVVLLAPGASPALAWEQEMAVLARDHTVYAVELPGQGETRLHHAGFTFDLDGMTAALGQFLDAMQLQSVVLGGNSWSGGWGLAYAQRHPERVSKLLLLAPSGLDEPDVWSWEVLKQPLVGEALAKLGASRSMVESSVRGLFFHKNLVTPQLIDAMWIPGTYRDNLRSMYALERGLDWRVTERALPATRQPTLILWGDHDTVLPPAQAIRFGQLLPNATVHVLEGCGHALTVDCPDQVTPLMTAFLSE